MIRRRIAQIEFIAVDDDRTFYEATSGSISARQRIVEAFLPLAATLATRRAKDGERAEDDLLQVCAERILTALDTFEYQTAPGANRAKFTAILQRALPGAITNYRRKDRLIPGVANSVRGRQLFYHPELAETAEDEALVEMQRGILEFDVARDEEQMNHVESPEDRLIEKEEQLEREDRFHAVVSFVEENFPKADAKAFWIVAKGSPGRRDHHQAGYERVHAAVLEEFGA